MAPGHADRRASGRVVHHLGLAHGTAVQAFRASGARGRIGPCLQLAPCYPADGSADARAAAASADVTENTLYLDPVLRGTYPDHLERDDPEVAAGVLGADRSGDLARVGSPVDLVALNYYSPAVLSASGPVTRYPVSAAGWQQVFPAGLRDVVLRVHREYGGPTILIAENGLPDEAGTVAEPAGDGGRVTFLRNHLLALGEAIDRGARVRGYHVWSLLDNFEWVRGYGERWGLVHVDFASQRRTPKDSARWCAEVSRSNKVPRS